MVELVQCGNSGDEYERQHPAKLIEQPGRRRERTYREQRKDRVLGEMSALADQRVHELQPGVTDVRKEEMKQRPDDQRCVGCGTIWAGEKKDDSDPNEERRV